MKRLLQSTILFLLLPALAQTSQVSYESFVSGLDKPVAMTNAGDSRVFVVEQHTGKIKVFDEDGTELGTYLSMAGKISTGNEQGLLGLAFHPNYKSNGYFYINYTTTSGSSRVCRFQVSGADSNMANAATETLIIQVSQPYSNHNGGSVVFGPDGYMYIGFGDGGDGGDPNGFAQNGNSLLGKMLRIDIDGGFPYTIPADNPFVSDANVKDEIWALGLRNPWKYSFDKETGDLWIGDVGQNDYEEIDLQLASSIGGENYGWRCYEGNNEYNTTGCAAQSSYDSAVFEYGRSGGACSVTGGYVYRGGKYTDITGHYFFSDYCTGEVWSLLSDGTGGFTLNTHADFGGNVVSFGEDISGQLYGLTISGELKKIITPSVVQGMSVEKESELFSIYPNPAEGAVHVVFQSSIIGDVIIVDMNGTEVLQDTISGDAYNFDGDMKEGVYLFKAITKEGIFTKKFTVK
jgi:hypothetical protein